MRRTPYLLVALALLAAAGCSRTDHVTAPDRTAAPRYDGGYIGSGYAIPADTTPITNSAQTDTTGRNGGYIGSGY